MKALLHNAMDQPPPFDESGTRTFSWTAPGDPAIWFPMYTALNKLTEANQPKFERLPVPIRYRATGAAQSWLKVTETAGDQGKRLLTALRNPGAALCQVLDVLKTIITDNPLPTPDEGAALGIASALLQGSLLMMHAQRQGGLFEPTPALHRMLAQTDVADAMPVRFFQPPMPALFIVPEPTMWRQPDGFEALLVLDHTGRETGRTNEPVARRFTFAAWARNAQGHSVCDWLEFAIEDEDMPLADVLERATSVARWQDAGPMKGMRDFDQCRWVSVLNYAVKMLLYLSVEDAQVNHDQAYTKAPRQFPGLGKRKRELRLAEVEHLYDRYVVGPAVLAGQAANGPHGATGVEVKTHWRRGHFRLQAHGPQASLRKVMFIMPTMVRADLLGN